MPLPERTLSYRQVDTSRTNTMATVENFLRVTGGDSTRKSPATYSPTSSSPSSPYFERMKHHDPEEDNSLYQKKSVLSKVKERAKKLRNSLSKRKQDDENITPSWGVSLEDDEEDGDVEEEEEEEDAEYLGAPMYESELAPEPYKENARQHPRADPVISEKHVLQNPIKSGVEKENDQVNPLSPVKSATTTTTQPASATTIPALNTKMTETIAEKVAPANAQGLVAVNSLPIKLDSVSTFANVSSQTSSIFPATSSAPSPMQNSSSLSSQLSGKNIALKSSSMKDYLMNKFEPRNDEKTGVSEPMSPRRTSSNNNPGVIEKVKGAVNSLLGNDEPSQQNAAKTTPTTVASSSQTSNTEQVAQEENHGRILQAN